MAEGFGAETLSYRNGARPHRLPFARSLPAPLGAVEIFAFDKFTLSAVRRFVLASAAEAGVEPSRHNDVILAASELAANSIIHGGGTGEARVWSEPDAFLCEVADRGLIDDASVGRHRPSPDEARGRGLWIVNQVADLMQVHSDEDGSAVRFRIDLD
jgi:anti-sigma regulatory factor (Ser/Thr protein kinase)